jgi:hypothetical protein
LANELDVLVHEEFTVETLNYGRTILRLSELDWLGLLFALKNFVLIVALKSS